MKDIENDVVLSVFEAREISERLEECIVDVKSGVPITESGLDNHLAKVMSVVNRVFCKDQPIKEEPEIPI